jgi:hypothetical protein
LNKKETVGEGTRKKFSCISNRFIIISLICSFPYQFESCPKMYLWMMLFYIRRKMIQIPTNVKYHVCGLCVFCLFLWLCWIFLGLCFWRVGLTSAGILIILFGAVAFPGGLCCRLTGKIPCPATVISQDITCEQLPIHSADNRIGLRGNSCVSPFWYSRISWRSMKVPTGTGRSVVFPNTLKWVTDTVSWDSCEKSPKSNWRRGIEGQGTRSIQVHFRAYTDQKGDRKERGVKIVKMYLNEKV